MVFLMWKITAHLSSVWGTHFTGTAIKDLFKACHTWILSVQYSEIRNSKQQKFFETLAFYDQWYWF